MSRTAVITRHFIPNYGSVLQAYATQALLRGFGHDSFIIDYREPTDGRTASPLSGPPRSIQSRARHALYRAYRGRDFRRRNELFGEFIQEELKVEGPGFHSFEELVRSVEQWGDASYCVGSDQVWNSDYNADSRPYHLRFAPARARKFSLASSIGRSSLAPGDERELVAALRSFVGVSVREAEAADYLASLGVDAQLHIDPTLALPAAHWSLFAGETVDERPYVLVYQLNANPELEAASLAVGRLLELPVRRIEYWKNFRGRGAHRLRRPGVRDFVRLFRDASFVLTDSFHGTAFSLNFQRPFVSFRPPRYASRIESILSLTGHDDRLITTAGEARDAASDRAGLRYSEQGAAILAAERLRLTDYVEGMST